MKPVPKLTEEQMKVFLQSAEVVDRKKLDTGTTGSVPLPLLPTSGGSGWGDGLVER